MLGHRRAVHGQQGDQPERPQQPRPAADRPEGERRGDHQHQRRPQQDHEPHPQVVAAIGPLDGANAGEAAIELLREFVPSAGWKQARGQPHRHEREGAGPDHDPGRRSVAGRTGQLEAAQPGQRRGRARGHRQHEDGSHHRRPAHEAGPVTRAEGRQSGKSGKPGKCGIDAGTGAVARRSPRHRPGTSCRGRAHAALPTRTPGPSRRP